jgi:hypothetical protein
VLQGPSNLLACGFFYFQWGCRVNFFKGHYFNYLSEEINFNCPFHSSQVFVGFLLILVGGNRCE